MHYKLHYWQEDDLKGFYCTAIEAHNTAVNPTKKLEKHACIASMSRKWNYWDNAVAESFFASLKKQILIGESQKTYEETEQIIFEAVKEFV